MIYIVMASGSFLGGSDITELKLYYNFKALKMSVNANFSKY